MSDLRQNLKSEFSDPDYRYAYAESFLNTKIATQIKTLREQRCRKQAELGALIGTKQSGFSRFEDVNHSVWKTDTLWKIARALDVRLNVSFETFGSLIDDKEHFDKESLQRPDFENDPAFKKAGQGPNVDEAAAARATKHRSFPQSDSVPELAAFQLVVQDANFASGTANTLPAENAAITSCTERSGEMREHPAGSSQATERTGNMVNLKFTSSGRKRLPPNPTVHCESGVLIELSEGRSCLIDAEDAEIVKPYRWTICDGRRAPYAVSSKRGKIPRTYMHRLILGLSPGDQRQVDHIDGNGLNNKRCNLRVSTGKENMWNQKSTGGKSRFRGVSWAPLGRKHWRARLRISGRSVSAGVFTSEEDAARAWDCKAREVYGEFARLNFPQA